jgi:hypothetical protein
MLKKFCTHTISDIFSPLRELVRRHITEAEMTDQSLALEFGEYGERLFNRSLRRSQYLTHAQIHHVEFVHAEISKIVLNCLDQFRRERA